MKTTFIRTSASDGLELHGLLQEPDTKHREIGIVHIHGMSGNFYQNYFLDVMAEKYTDSGYGFIRLNNRGHDLMADTKIIKGDEIEWRRIGCAYDTLTEANLDIEAAIESLKAAGYTKYILQGHSLGGTRVVNYMATIKRGDILGVVLLSSTDMIGYIEKQTNHVKLLAQAKHSVANSDDRQLLPGFVWLDDFQLSAATYVELSERGGIDDIFQSFNDQPATITEVTVPILSFMGTLDEGPKAMGISARDYLDMVKRKVNPATKLTVHEVNSVHSYRGHETEVADTVVEWAKELT